MKRYLLVIHGDVEPEILGPFPSAKARNVRAVALRSKDREGKDGVFALDTSGKADVAAYPARYFDDK